MQEPGNAGLLKGSGSWKPWAWQLALQRAVPGSAQPGCRDTQSCLLCQVWSLAAQRQQERAQSSPSALLMWGFHSDLLHWHLSDWKKETFSSHWVDELDNDYFKLVLWAFFQCLMVSFSGFLQSSSTCSMTWMPKRRVLVNSLSLSCCFSSGIEVSRRSQSVGAAQAVRVLSRCIPSLVSRAFHLFVFLSQVCGEVRAVEQWHSGRFGVP